MKESYFSNTVCKTLRDAGVFVQRIESYLTARGIPDIYYATIHESGWIELKVAHGNFTGDCHLIHWREGQQAWLTRHYKYNPKTYTLVHFDDCICAIPASKLYEKHSTILTCIRSSNLIDVLRQM